MPFEAGQVSNPEGRNGKQFKAALNIAIKRVENDKTALARIAEALVSKAEGGDVQAIKEVADRLDGKAIQALEHSGPDGGAIPVTKVLLGSLADDDSTG